MFTYACVDQHMNVRLRNEQHCDPVLVAPTSDYLVIPETAPSLVSITGHEPELRRSLGNEMFRGTA